MKSSFAEALIIKILKEREGKKRAADIARNQKVSEQRLCHCFEISCVKNK